MYTINTKASSRFLYADCEQSTLIFLRFIGHATLRVQLCQNVAAVRSNVPAGPVAAYSSAASSSGTSASGTPLTFLTEDEKVMQETGKEEITKSVENSLDDVWILFELFE